MPQTHERRVTPPTANGGAMCELALNVDLEVGCTVATQPPPSPSGEEGVWFRCGDAPRSSEPGSAAVSVAHEHRPSRTCCSSARVHLALAHTHTRDAMSARREMRAGRACVCARSAFSTAERGEGSWVVSHGSPSWVVSPSRHAGERVRLGVLSTRRPARRPGSARRATRGWRAGSSQNMAVPLIREER